MKAQKKIKTMREKRMTIILLKAYKQHPCAHIYTNAPEQERKARERGIL